MYLAVQLPITRFYNLLFSQYVKELDQMQCANEMQMFVDLNQFYRLYGYI